MRERLTYRDGMHLKSQVVEESCNLNKILLEFNEIRVSMVTMKFIFSKNKSTFLTNSNRGKRDQ